MDITSLPSEYEIKNLNCSLTIMKVKYFGWLVTYMYYDQDLLGMDFYPTLQDSIDALCEKLDIKPEIITESWLEENGYHHESIQDILHRWVSEDGRVALTKDCSNFPGRDWHVHIDNEDFSSIGSMDVQEVWQLEAFLRLMEIKR